MKLGTDTKQLVVLGCNGNAWDVVEAVLALNREEREFNILGYLDDDPAKASHAFLGFSVLGKLCDAPRFRDSCFAYCVGSTANFRSRHTILSQLGLDSRKFPAIVHPDARVSSSASVGAGVFVSMGSYIGPFASLGDFSVILSHCLVSHETTVGAFSILAGGAKLAGRICVGRNCYLGGGCLVRNDLRIGDGALVGLGAVVCKDVLEGSTVAGNPARLLVQHSQSGVASERSTK